MILPHLKGGLGNQLFQYAYGRALSMKKNEPLVLDISGYAMPNSKDTPREYRLDHFNIEAGVITEADHTLPRSIYFIWRVMRKLGIASEVIQWSKNTHLDGYFQSESYFREIAGKIRGEITLKVPYGSNGQIIHSAIQKNVETPIVPISIHIRRGDYVHNQITNHYHGVCGSEYYEEAFSLLKQKINSPIHLYIFSDDIEWVQKNLPFTKENSTFVSSTNTPDYEEVILMSECHHHIIANSSFSWWGAWLNPRHDKIVITPKRWTLGDPKSYEQITPPSWIRI